MKILFILPRFPAPAIGGDQVRALNQLRALAGSHEVTLLTREPVKVDLAAYESVNRLCRHVITVRRGGKLALSKLSAHSVRSLPLQAVLEFDSALGRAAFGLTRTQQFDVAHVQLARIGPVVHWLPPSLPTVLDLVDALSVNMKRRADQSRGALSWLARWEGRRMATYEQALTKLYDRLVVASPADLTAIGEYNNLSVVPNGVDVKANPYFAGPRERQSIVFSGTMFYFPNVDAARWFAGEIFPLVRQAIPGAIVSFVGTRPTRTIRALARPGLINVTGFVPSVYKFVSGATVAVAPMRSGSGTQFKVLEAMSAGTPVIGTSLAFAGLAVTDGLHALTADSAQDFAGRVIEVMSNPSRYRPMAEAARRLVEERYDWAVTVRALENAYAEAIEIRQSAGASA